MMINRQNYEQYAIDFIEGKLCPSEYLLFNDFLSKNKDIDTEIQQLKANYNTLSFDDKLPDFSFLQKDINTISIDDSNFEEICIAYYENDLNHEAKSRLLHYTANSLSAKDKFELYGRLKLSPDKNIAFKDKSLLNYQPNSLYSFRRMAIITTLATAASVAFFFFFQNPVRNLKLQNLAHTSINQATTQETQANSTNSTIITNKLVKESQTGNKQKPIKIKQLTPLLAAIDTTSSEEDDFIRISMIDASPIMFNRESAEIAILPQSTDSIQNNRKPRKIKSFKEKSRNVLAKAKHITVNEVIETSINGINNMAETNLRYIAQTDDKGRITELELSSGTFNFSRKLRNN